MFKIGDMVRVKQGMETSFDGEAGRIIGQTQLHGRTLWKVSHGQNSMPRLYSDPMLEPLEESTLQPNNIVEELKALMEVAAKEDSYGAENTVLVLGIRGIIKKYEGKV